MSGAFLQTTYVDQRQLEEWFAGAAIGDKVAYAFGPCLILSNPVDKLVKDWIATGEVNPFQKTDASGRRMYWVQRARPKFRAEQAPRVRVDPEWADTSDGKIFLALVRATNFDDACPSNSELARLAGLPDADAARYRMKCLAQQGLITIQHEGPGRALRRVRINQTGKWTADHGRAVLPGFEKGHAA